MPPKHAAVDLDAVKASDDEMETVRQLLAKPGKTQSNQMAKLNHFLKLFPQEKVKQSRGELRVRHLELFLVRQPRSKGAKKTPEVARKSGSSQHRFTDLHWWSQEIMDREIGDERGAAGRQ